MGEVLECLEDLDLMSRRRGSTWQSGSNETDHDDGAGRARRHCAQQLATILCRRLARKDQGIFVSISTKGDYKAYLARKDQEVEMRARSEGGQPYIRLRNGAQTICTCLAQSGGGAKWYDTE